ncbi:MAG: O-antigen ligase family protein [Gammaproteobacteria bacterium]|nr:O-antigen ligase family protein [Gammaproteobacteria bacterium]
MFLVVLPLPHTVSLRLIALGCMGLVSAMIVQRTDMPPLPLKIPLLLWTGLALISLLWTKHVAYSFSEIKNEIFYTILAYFVFFSQTRDDATWQRWMNWLWLSASFILIGALVAWYHGDTIRYIRYLYPGVGSYTTFIVSVFPFFLLSLLDPRFSSSRKALMGIIMALLLVTAFATGNRIFWIALVSSALVFFGLLSARTADRKRRRLILYSLVGGCVASVVALLFVLRHRMQLAGANEISDIFVVVEQTASHDPRLQIWSFISTHFWEQPWTGLGFGLRSFSTAYPELAKVDPTFWHPHNLILHYGMQLGIFGVLVLFLLFGAIIRHLWRIYRDPDVQLMRVGAAGLALVAGVIVKNMTDMFFSRENSLLFWSLLGMTLGYAAFRRRQRLAKGTD